MVSFGSITGHTAATPASGTPAAGARSASRSAKLPPSECPAATGTIWRMPAACAARPTASIPSGWNNVSPPPNGAVKAGKLSS